MRYIRRKKQSSEEANYKLLIEYQKLFHYESLFIKKIDEIILDYKTQYSNSKLFTFISLFLPILGYTNDVIGVKILKNIQGYKEILYYILLLAPSILLILWTVKYKKAMESLNIEFMKEDYKQEEIFLKYMIDKLKEKKELNNHIWQLSGKKHFDSDLLQDYFSQGNRIKITFSKQDLRHYLHEYIKNLNKSIAYELSDYLSEVIIAKELIKNNIKQASYESELEYIIDNTNIMGIYMILSK